MRTLFDGDVQVRYGQFYFELNGSFDGAMEDCFVGQNNGLCGAQNPAILFLMTGLHTGPVGLSINVFDIEPDVDDSWQEVVEVSLVAPHSHIALVEWAADQSVGIDLSPGTYRARYSGQAMEAANEINTNIEDVPVDRYRLDLWPAPFAKDRIVKQTSSVADYWHDWAGKLADAA